MRLEQPLRGQAPWGNIDPDERTEGVGIGGEAWLDGGGCLDGGGGRTDGATEVTRYAGMRRFGVVACQKVFFLKKKILYFYKVSKKAHSLLGSPALYLEIIPYLALEKLSIPFLCSGCISI